MDDRAGSIVSPLFERSSSVQRPSHEPDPLKGGDVYKWAVEQATLIRKGQYDAIDWVNVADEIESVGNSEFRTLASNIEFVLIHMLKWDHQAERRSRSWSGSIIEHRQRIISDLSDSPSLKSRLQEAVDRGYRLGRIVAARQTRLPLQNFPKACPYNWGVIMDSPCILDPATEIE